MNERIAPGERLSWEVIGKPAPGGSKTARPLYGKGRKPVMKDGRPIIVQTNASKRTKPWQNLVAEAAVHEWGPRDLYALDCPLTVALTFFFERPQSDFRKDGTLRPGAEILPRGKGDDLDKLARSTLDAMQGIVYTNDRRAVTLLLARRFGSPERCEITVVRPSFVKVSEMEAPPLSAEDEFAQLGLLDAVGA